MKPNSINDILAPLTDFAYSQNCPSLSVFGSTVTCRRWTDASDIDVHILLNSMTSELWRDLRAAAEDAAARAARAARAVAEAGERAGIVELRHGPFKPDPADGPIMQLHLIVDDWATLAAGPFLLRMQRAVTAKPLVGAIPLPLDVPRDQLAREAAAELNRWDRAAADGHIPYRAWCFDPTPHLTDGRAPANTEWERRCLQRATLAARCLYGSGG